MTITDLFIRRPVLSIAISIIIFIMGFRSIFELQLRQFPEMNNTVITVMTVYPGASADTILGFITAPIERAIASSEGIDYITAKSTQGVSTIQAYIKLGRDPNKAFTDIMSKVAEVRHLLPRESEAPVIEKETGSRIALMYISFSSEEMGQEEITEYITRVVQPKLESVSGVSKAQVFGASKFALRIWFDPQRIAAFNITADDITRALHEKNYITAAGEVKGQYVVYNISATTEIRDLESFKSLIIRRIDGRTIRLSDVAQVELGSQNYDSLVTYNGNRAVFVGISANPTANPLTVINDVYDVLPLLEKNYPPSLKANVGYDATTYIRSSIHEVITTIVEATAIVIFVILLFIGSFRAVLIPMVTIPLSLVGVCSLMLWLGYSINVLTLLAMVLAIGLVVDDAIVVVENIHRHLEEGMKPMDAALKGAREIALPVIAMTITLAAVYTPIGFMTGVTGSLFKEFAFTLACAVIISGIIALVLSPMMCSQMLSSAQLHSRFASTVDRTFSRLTTLYQRMLTSVLNYRPVVVVFACVVLTSCIFLFIFTQKELAPEEDQSVIFISGTASVNANIENVSLYTEAFKQIFHAIPESSHFFAVSGLEAVNNVFAGLILKPWHERNHSQSEVTAELQQHLNGIAGLRAVAFPLPSIPVANDGLPLQFVITTTQPHELVYEAIKKLEVEARKSGLFMFVDSNLEFNRPEAQIDINRERAAQLGISMESIGNTLATALSDNFINRFNMQGQAYQVIPRVERQYQLEPEALTNMHIRTASGTMIPLSTIVTLNYRVLPNHLWKFQQLNAAMISGMMAGGRTIDEGLAFLREKTETLLSNDFSYDYSGQSRQYIQEGNELIITFFFALMMIYLVLAAQFESFRDPFIILISVPMSICGALIFLNLGLATINIYTQIGLITLIGLISKHGILMVDFANKCQEQEKLPIRQAITKAASIRLRPILMTTAAMVFGVIPLILSSGAGAKSRFSIGLVIATGMTIGTLFTLFVVPTIYTFLARKHMQVNAS